MLGAARLRPPGNLTKVRGRLRAGQAADEGARADKNVIGARQV